MNEDFDGLTALRQFADEWRIISGTSIDAGFYIKLLSFVTDEELTAAEIFAENLAGIEEQETVSGDNENESGKEEETSTLSNLELSIYAEFGIAEDMGDELISEDDLLEWDAFIDDAQTYAANLALWKKDRLREKLKLNDKSYATYANLTRSGLCI